MNRQTSAKLEDTEAQDFGVATTHDTVRLECLLPGPIERVGRYLTESEARGQWLARGEMDLRVGWS